MQRHANLMGQGVKDLVDSKKQNNSISGLELSSVKSWELDSNGWIFLEQCISTFELTSQSNNF